MPETIVDPYNYERLLVVNADGSINVNATLQATPTIDIGDVSLIDGTNSAIKQAVKAASTAALATDPSAVVALSPNSPVPAGTNIIGRVGIDQTTPGTTNGIYVNTIASGQNVIGNVGGKSVSVTVTPTVTASNSYGTNFVIGGLLTFANAFTSTGTGILQSLIVTCKRVELNQFVFYPFAANPNSTTWTDAAVANINAADVSKVRTPILLTNNSGLGTMTVASATGIGMAMAPGTTALYGVLLTQSTLTNQFTSTSDITVTAVILQDA